MRSWSRWSVNCVAEDLKVARGHCGTSHAYAARLCERARPSILCGFDCRDACSWAAKAHSYAKLKVFATLEIISPTSGLNAILGAALVPSG